MALAEEAEPINFTMTEDSDADGLLSDEPSPLHTVVVTYIDNYQRVDDVTWRFRQYGPGDGDNLLESGERFLITVGADKKGRSGLLARALNPDLGAGDTFTIEVRTPDGKVLAIRRAVPPRLTPVVNLH